MCLTCIRTKRWTLTLAWEEPKIGYTLIWSLKCPCHCIMSSINKKKHTFSQHKAAAKEWMLKPKRIHFIRMLNIEFIWLCFVAYWVLNHFLNVEWMEQCQRQSNNALILSASIYRQNNNNLGLLTLFNVITLTSILLHRYTTNTLLIKSSHLENRMENRRSIIEYNEKMVTKSIGKHFRFYSLRHQLHCIRNAFTYSVAYSTK